MREWKQNVKIFIKKFPFLGENIRCRQGVHLSEFSYAYLSEGKEYPQRRRMFRRNLRLFRESASLYDVG